MSETVTGIAESAVEEFPSCPEEFRPQHLTSEFMTTQPLSLLTESDVAPEMPITRAAPTRALPTAPSPSWPKLLSPQHQTTPT